MRVHVPDAFADRPAEYVATHYAAGIVESAMAFSRITYERSKLSLREFEVARMRTAQINGCMLCLNWRSYRDVDAYVRALGGGTETVASHGPVPDEDFYNAVGDASAYPFTAREQIAMEYAEGLGQAPQLIAKDEDFWRRARAAFSDEDMVDLSYCIACWMGLGRVAHVLGIDSVCQIPALNKPLVTD